MSNKLLNLVRDAEIGNPTAKEVLKCIADQANDAGTSVWSSIAYFMFSTERSRTAVKDALNFLQNEEFILHVGRTRFQTNRWKVNINKLEDLRRIWRSPEEDDLEGVVSRPTKDEGGSLDVDEGSLDDHKPQEPINKNTVTEETEEPTYVELEADETPSEVQMELDNFLTGWKTCFPNKPQPRATSAMKKFKTRFQNEGFRSKWREALWATKDLEWAHEEGWFKWSWFLHNNENYAKLLDGTFDFKSRPDTVKNMKRMVEPKRRVDVDYRIEE